MVFRETDPRTGKTVEITPGGHRIIPPPSQQPPPSSTSPQPPGPYDKVIQQTEQQGIPDDQTLTNNAVNMLQRQGYTGQGAMVNGRLVPYGYFSVKLQSGREFTPQSHVELVRAIVDEQKYQYRLSGSYFGLQGYEPSVTPTGEVVYTKPIEQPPSQQPQTQPTTGGLVTSPEQHQALQNVGKQVLGVFDIFGISKVVTPDESGVSPIDRYMPNIAFVKPGSPEYEMLVREGAVPYEQYTGVKPSDITITLLSTLQGPAFMSGFKALPEVLIKVLPKAAVTAGMIETGAAFGVMAAHDIVKASSPQIRGLQIFGFAGQMITGAAVSGIKTPDIMARMRSIGDVVKSKMPAFYPERVFDVRTGEVRLYLRTEVLGRGVRLPFYLKGEAAVDMSNLVRGYHPMTEQMTLENFMGRRKVYIGEATKVPVTAREYAQLTGREIFYRGMGYASSEKAAIEGYQIPESMKAWGYTRIGGEDIILDTRLPRTELGSRIASRQWIKEYYQSEIMETKPSRVAINEVLKDYIATGELPVPSRESVLRHELLHAAIGVKSHEAISKWQSIAYGEKKPFYWYLRDNEVVISERLPGKTAKQYSLQDIVKQSMDEVMKPKPFKPSSTLQLKLIPGEKPSAPVTIADLMKGKEPKVVPKSKTTALTFDDILRGRGELITVEEGKITSVELERLTPKDIAKRTFSLSDIVRKPLYDLSKPTEEVTSGERTVEVLRTYRPVKADSTIETPDIMYVQGSPKLLNYITWLESGLMPSQHWVGEKPERPSAEGLKVQPSITISGEGFGTFTVVEKQPIQANVRIQDVTVGLLTEQLRGQRLEDLQRQRDVELNRDLFASMNLSGQVSGQMIQQMQENALDLRQLQDMRLELQTRKIQTTDRIKIIGGVIKFPEGYGKTVHGEGGVVVSWIVGLRSRQYSHGERIAGSEYHKASKPLTWEDAMSLGMDVTGKTEKASFILIPSEKKPQALGKGVPRWTEKIGQFTKNEKGAWVEKSEFRINSPGERAAITMKGIEARRHGH